VDERVRLEFPEVDIAATVVLLKAYAGTTGDFPASVLIVGNSAWRDAATTYLRKQRERAFRGERIDVRRDPAMVCDTPYSKAMLQ